MCLLLNMPINNVLACIYLLKVEIAYKIHKIEYKYMLLNFATKRQPPAQPVCNEHTSVHNAGNFG